MHIHVLNVAHPSAFSHEHAIKTQTLAKSLNQVPTSSGGNLSLENLELMSTSLF